MARPWLEISPYGFAQSLSFNEVILFTILGNATEPLNQKALQARYDATFNTTSLYNEIGTMVVNIRRKGYDIRSKKHVGYWLTKETTKWA